MSQIIGTTWDELRQIALSYPGVEEGKWYGTPAFLIRKKGLIRLREDGESLVIHIDEFERDLLLKAEPEIFFITDHYVGWPYILVRMAKVQPDHLCKLLEQEWRRVAPKRLVAEYDQSIENLP